MKKLILLGISCVMLQTLSHTQENTEDTLYRQFLLITELNTGTIVNDTDGYLAGNELELAIEYKQNFAKASWLSWYVKGAAIGNLTVNNLNLNKFDDTIANPDLDPKWRYNGVSSASLGLGYLETGLRFDKYGYIAVRHHGFIKAYAFAPIEFGGNQTFTFLGGIEAFPYVRGTKYVSPDVEMSATDPSISVLALGINYNILFHENWGFTTELQYRTDGRGTASRTGNSAWDVDSLDALKYNSYFRFDNTFTYTTSDNAFSVWFQVRYMPQYFIELPIVLTQRRGAIQHDVYLRAGMTYAFDI